MKCQIIKNFAYSQDGKTELTALKGETHDIPADLVEGLKAEGYVRPGKAPENKMQADTLETGAVVNDQADDDDDAKAADLAEARAAYAEAFGKAAPMNWGAEAIRNKIVEA